MTSEDSGPAATEARDRSQNEDVAEEQDNDLRTSLAALGSVATSQLDLRDLLTAVANFAVRAIPGADGAGLTLLQEHRSDTIVTTAPFVQEVDDIQYSIRQGPCITAAAEGITVRSGSLGGDERWRHFGSRVARLGVHSALSLPLVTPNGVLGAINVYAHAKHVFDDRAAELGELFAVPAAIAVQTAQALDQAKRLAVRLQSALDYQSVVDRAVGILMSRGGGDEEEALARLRALSQHDHRKLAEVAQGIIDETVRKARARRTAAD